MTGITRDLVERLIGVLERETEAFEATQLAMQSDREAFVSMRKQDVEQRFPLLLDLAERSLQLARERERLQEALGEQLGTATVTLSSLRPCVPVDLAARLDDVAGRARLAASRARVQSRVGERLLALARRWRAAMLGLAELEQPRTAAYDRRARVTREAHSGGNLLRGTI